MYPLLLLLQTNLGGSSTGLALLIAVALALLLFPGRRPAHVNSVEEARLFALNYHAKRTRPYTDSEERALITTIMRSYGLSEETAAEVVASSAPPHRTHQPNA